MSDKTQPTQSPGIALSKALESFQRTIESNPRPDDPKLANQFVPTVIQLPFWPDPMRGAPNASTLRIFRRHSKKFVSRQSKVEPERACVV